MGSLARIRIGRYRILERIGQGHVGTMFKALDPVLDRLVTLIVVSGGLHVTEEVHGRFYREARNWAGLNHPNVATVYEFGHDDDLLFVALEFIRGEDLGHLATHERDLSLQAKLSLMVQICDGLQHAHESGILHGRIEPRSIFVQPTGQVKILDFGVDDAIGAADIPESSRPITGSHRYMAPERVWGRVDCRSDIFSVAAVFYELLTLRPLFASQDPGQVLIQILSPDPAPAMDLGPTIPPSLAAALEKALRKDPAGRFSSVGELRTQLENALVDGILARPGAPREEASPGTQAQVTASAAGPLRAPENPELVVAGTARPAPQIRRYRQLVIAAGLLVAAGAGAFSAFGPLRGPTRAPVSGQGEQLAAVTPSVSESAAGRRIAGQAARSKQVEATAKPSMPRSDARAGQGPRAMGRAGSETILGASRDVVVGPGRTHGISGPVAWELADVRFEAPSGSRDIRWSYTLVIRGLTSSTIQLDREVRSASRGFADATVSRVGRSERLQANSELRLPVQDTIGLAAPEPSFVGVSSMEEIRVWHRLYGTDEEGRQVRIDIRFPLKPT